MRYNHTKKKISLSKTRIGISFRDLFEEFQRNVVRKRVHSFWFKRENKAVSNYEFLMPISWTNLFHLLFQMEF